MEHLTLESFKEKVCECGIGGGDQEWAFKGSLPAVIDFYADWCGPCKMIAPMLEKLATEFSEKLVIYKVDTEAQQNLAGLFGISSIPSILFIPMTEKPQMLQGALPESEFRKAFKDILNVE